MLIGEVAQHSGVSARMLRHYDRIGLLTPTGRTTAGYREYSQADVERLFHIEGLRTLGLDLVLRTVALLHALNVALPSRRQQIALVVDGTDQRDAAALVASLLSEHNEDAAGALAWAISRAGDVAVPQLSDALDSPDELQRRRALDALEKIGTPAALASIAAATASHDVRVRTHAMLDSALSRRISSHAEEPG